MKQPSQAQWKYAGICRMIPVVASIAYLMITYQALPQLNTHHMSKLAFFVLQLSVILPQTAIWMIAMRGALHMKQYAAVIRRTADGIGLEYIADALIGLVLYIISLPLLRNVSYLFIGQTHEQLAVNAASHVPIVLMALSVGYLYAGARRLDAIVSMKLWTRRRLLALIGALSVLGLAFLVYFIVIVPQLPGDAGVPRFALPMHVLVFSYALPQVLIWLFGCLACFSLAHYTLQTPGRIYKKAFERLNIGLLIAIGCIFAAQLLVLSPVSLSSLNMGVMLIYGVLLLATYGFVLISRGADSLLKIEEVG